LLEAAAAVFVKLKLAGAAIPVAVAVTVYGPPTVAFAVKTAEVATPLAFVVAVFAPPANVPLAPVAGGVNVTTTPLTPAPPFVTVATSGAAKAVLTAALCGVPLVAAIVSGAVAVLVRLKLAGAAIPVAVAVTVYGPPTVAFAVKTAEVATPLAFVVAVFAPPANVPLAPVAGGVNVTTTPLTPAPPFVTVATNGAAKAVLTAALCGVPLVAVIISGGATVLVRLKLAAVATPVTLAVTT
jgi:hypothetical protein